MTKLKPGSLYQVKTGVGIRIKNSANRWETISGSSNKEGHQNKEVLMFLEVTKSMYPPRLDLLWFLRHDGTKIYWPVLEGSHLVEDCLEKVNL